MLKQQGGTREQGKEKQAMVKSRSFDSYRSTKKKTLKREHNIK